MNAPAVVVGQVPADGVVVDRRVTVLAVDSASCVGFISSDSIAGDRCI